MMFLPFPKPPRPCLACDPEPFVSKLGPHQSSYYRTKWLGTKAPRFSWKRRCFIKLTSFIKTSATEIFLRNQRVMASDLPLECFRAFGALEKSKSALLNIHCFHKKFCILLTPNPLHFDLDTVGQCELSSREDTAADAQIG